MFPGRETGFHTAEGHFQADTHEDFQSLRLETDACGYLYEPEDGKEDLKRVEEEFLLQEVASEGSGNRRSITPQRCVRSFLTLTASFRL